MIELKDINIKFRDPIIKQGTITLLQHQITLLTGASGSGKSSLLNILGLLDDTNQFQYLWDKKAITPKDYERLKQYEIAYVFQNYNLINDLDIEDNFKAMFQIAGIPFSKQRMQELLQEVALESVSLNQKTKSLSGGEKQRLAIALSLVKEPKLLLLDEPTANLDEENSKMIVTILHQIKQKDIMIAIATHHPDRYHADHIYEIKERNIIEIQPTDAVTENAETPKQSRKRFASFAYARLHFVSHFLMYALLLTALLFSFYQISKGLMNIFAAKQSMDENIKSVAEDELFINNTEVVLLDSDKYHYQHFLHPFKKEKISEVTAIPHVKKIYPYFMLLDDTYPTLEEDGSISLRFFPDAEGNDNTSVLNEVTYQNKTVNTRDRFSDYLIFASCDKEKMSRSSIKTDQQVNSGIFIPKELADALHIDKLDHTEIQLYMPILMGYTNSTGSNESGSVSVETRPLAALYCKTTLEVQGIYESDWSINQYYDIYSKNRILIDYRTIEQYHNEIIKNEDLMKQYHDVVTKHLYEGHDFYPNDTSSAYIAQIDDAKFTDDVREQVYKTLDNVYVKSKGTEKGTLYQSLQEVAAMSLVMPAIIFLVTTVLMMILYIYTLHARKKELAYLQANGIRRIHRIPFSNQVMIVVPACFIGFIMAYLLEMNYYEGIVMYHVLLTNIIALIMLILVYYIISYLYFRHMDIRKELHSN